MRAVRALSFISPNGACENATDCSRYHRRYALERTAAHFRHSPLMFSGFVFCAEAPYGHRTSTDFLSEPVTEFTSPPAQLKSVENV